MNLYEEHFVWWRQDSHCAIRYTCLKNLHTGMYCVHSADFLGKIVMINSSAESFWSYFLMEILKTDVNGLILWRWL